MILSAVQNGLSVRQAASKFLLPKSTVERHVKNPRVKANRGPK